MASEDPDSEKPFKVQDRRRFSATGDARPEDEVAAAPAPPPTAAPPEAPSQADSDAPSAEDFAAHMGEPAELSFATFVISLEHPGAGAAG